MTKGKNLKQTNMLLSDDDRAALEKKAKELGVSQVSLVRLFCKGLQAGENK